MEILIRFYRRCNLLSLDVAVGAVICSLYFSKLLSVTARAQEMVALGFTVWIIYSVDRLLDVRTLSNTAATERHQFHQQYQKPLWILSILTGLITLCFVYFLRSPILVGGIFLSLTSGLYLLLQKYLKMKEFFVAVVYTAGILLTSLAITTVEISYEEGLLIMQFFMVALINLLLFSWFEYDADKQDGNASFAIGFGKKTTRKWVLSLSAINCFVTIWVLTQTAWQLPSLLFLLMTIVLIIIFIFPTYFQVGQRYRMIGDAVFFIPVIGLLS
jgi:1,4-dihydroxy-2-naphthoate octaprenyltransferase